MSEFLTEYQKTVLANRKNVVAIYRKLEAKAKREGCEASRWRLCGMTAQKVGMTPNGVSKVLKSQNM